MRIEDRLFDRGWVRSAMATRKCGNIYFRKYFVAVRKFTNIFVLLLILMVVVVVVVDSHIQRIVLATEETTVTQQVSHRPIKRQSRLWSQRGTKVNGSHHGDNPLLRPTGIQIATKSYAALQAMAPTNIKTVHQTSLLHSRATSIDSECCRLPTTSVLSKKPEKLRSNQF